MKRRIIGLLSACLVVFSCGYRLRGTGSYLPSHIKRISIPMFKNMTTRYELDLKLTRAVINEMTARAKVEVLAERGRADAVLIGRGPRFHGQAYRVLGSGGRRPLQYHRHRPDRPPGPGQPEGPVLQPLLRLRQGI